MHEIEIVLTDDEMRRVALAAEQQGITVDEWVTRAARAELRARYVLPSTDGKVVPFSVPQK